MCEGRQRRDGGRRESECVREGGGRDNSLIFKI